MLCQEADPGEFQRRGERSDPHDALHGGGGYPLLTDSHHGQRAHAVSRYTRVCPRARVSICGSRSSSYEALSLPVLYYCIGYIMRHQFSFFLEKNLSSKPFRRRSKTYNNLMYIIVSVLLLNSDRDVDKKSSQMHFQIDIFQTYKVVGSFM